MAKAPTRPKEKDRDEGEEGKEEITVTPDAHDAPGLSPFERMAELTRRIVNVPKAEIERTRKTT
jgi:hypothetical protein